MQQEQHPVAAFHDINLVDEQALIGAIVQRLNRIFRIARGGSTPVRRDQQTALFPDTIEEIRKRAQFNGIRGIRFTDCVRHIFLGRAFQWRVKRAGIRLTGRDDETRGQSECGIQRFHGFELSFLADPRPATYTIKQAL